MGGDASRNEKELFETEADFSAKIVTFRLVGGMHPPLNPPLVLQPLHSGSICAERVWHISRSMDICVGNANGDGNGDSRCILSFFPSKPCIRVRVRAAMPV